jgi:hypothetical protein
MSVRKVFEYVLVTGLWAAFVFYIVSPYFSDHYRSVTTFDLLVPFVVYWVVRERLLVWENDDTDA